MLNLKYYLTNISPVATNSSLISSEMEPEIKSDTKSFITEEQFNEALSNIKNNSAPTGTMVPDYSKTSNLDVGFFPMTSTPMQGASIFIGNSYTSTENGYILIDFGVDDSVINGEVRILVNDISIRNDYLSGSKRDGHHIIPIAKDDSIHLELVIYERDKKIYYTNSSIKFVPTK